MQYAIFITTSSPPYRVVPPFYTAPYQTPPGQDECGHLAFPIFHVNSFVTDPNLSWLHRLRDDFTLASACVTSPSVCTLPHAPHALSISSCKEISLSHMTSYLNILWPFLLVSLSSSSKIKLWSKELYPLRRSHRPIQPNLHVPQTFLHIAIGPRPARKPQVVQLTIYHTIAKIHHMSFRSVVH
jgi:hypothetical protein